MHGSTVVDTRCWYKERRNLVLGCQLTLFFCHPAMCYVETIDSCSSHCSMLTRGVRGQQLCKAQSLALR